METQKILFQGVNESLYGYGSTLWISKNGNTAQ